MPIMKSNVIGEVTDLKFEVTNVRPIGCGFGFRGRGYRPPEQHRMELHAVIDLTQLSVGSGGLVDFEKCVTAALNEVLGGSIQEQITTSHKDRRIEDLTRANKALQEKLRQADAKATAMESLKQEVVSEHDKLQAKIDAFDSAMQSMMVSSTRFKSRRADLESRRSSFMQSRAI